MGNYIEEFLLFYLFSSTDSFLYSSFYYLKFILQVLKYFGFFSSKIPIWFIIFSIYLLKISMSSLSLSIFFICFKHVNAC